MYINLYAWNGHMYESFQKALEYGEVIEIVRYQNRDSLEYKILIQSLENFRNGTDSDGMLSFHEEPFVSDTNWTFAND